MINEKSKNINSDEQNNLVDKRRKNWFWDTNDVFGSDLSPYAKLVRFYLARCANQDRQAWPSYNNIAKECKISRDTAKKAVAELEEKSWIEKKVQKKGNGEHLSNIYFLCDAPEPEKIEPEKTGFAGEQGGCSQHPPCHDLDGVGADSTHLGAHNTYVGAETAPNNTNITITNKQDKKELFISERSEDINNNAAALQADRAVAVDISPDKSPPHDSHPQAGVADLEKDKERGNEPSVAKELIAELVRDYRAIEGVVKKRGDYAFLGEIYNKYGYSLVLEGISELKLAVLAREINTPLLYLKGIVASLSEPGKSSKICVEKPDRRTHKSRLDGKNNMKMREKEKEILKNLYMS